MTSPLEFNEISSHDSAIVTQSTLLEDGGSSDKKTSSSEAKKTLSSEDVEVIKPIHGVQAPAKKD